MIIFKSAFLLNVLKTVYSCTSARLQATNSYSMSVSVLKKALVFLAPGAEELEFVTITDILRRAEIDVTVAGVQGDGPVKCSRGVNIIPDVAIQKVTSKGPFDVMVLPGGLGGSQALAKSEDVGVLLKAQEKQGKFIAAICAAPIALKIHGIGVGKQITSYPSVEVQLTEGGSYIYKTDRVVVDGKIITSRGPGTASDFAFKIVELLVSKTKATEVSEAMLMQYSL